MDKYHNPLQLRAIKVTIPVLIAMIVAIALPTLSFAAPSEAEEAYPPVNYGSGGKAEQIKRGEYLAKAGDCIACHSTPGGKAFAGGLAVKTPFGTIYTSNITPDNDTGLGRWTDEQFITAMREGIDAHGDYLLPAFPYLFYNKMNRQDILDIRAYLEAIPAVHQPNKPLDMPFPFKIRELQSFWRFLFFDFSKGEFVPDTRKSPEWNRGAYLVEGLGHCAMCHTPMNAIGGWKREYDLTGGSPIEGYRAPNISASATKDIPIEKIVAVFTKDEKWTGGDVQGPMLQVNHDSLRYLTPEDLAAIATYLKTVQSKMPPAPAGGSGEKAGQMIYEQYCSGCHNQGAGGAPKFGVASQWQPLIKPGMAQVYQHAIHGIRGMPPKGNCDSCTDEQVKATVDYMVKSSQGGGTVKAAPTIEPAQAYTSLAKGKQVYDKVCSVCHEKGQLGAPKLGDQSAWDPIMKQSFDVLVNRAIGGYKGHPAMGACYPCTEADVISAVKYMAQQSKTGDYRLW